MISDAPMAKDAIIQAPSKGDDSSLPLHERIRTACGQRSIQEIARGIGTNPETTRRYLRGICRPTPEFLAGVCDFANVSAQWLLLGIGPRSLTEAATETLKRTSTQALVAELVERVSDNSTAVNDIDAAIVQILRQCFPDGRQVGSNRSSSGGETLVCSNSHHKSKK